MRRFHNPLLFTILLFSLCASGWSRDLTRYAIVLNDAPAATVAGRNDEVAMTAAVARIRSAHEPVKAELSRRNIQITGEAHTLLNAIFVAIDPTRLRDLDGLPGVSYVAKMPRYHLELDAAVKLIGVPGAWSLLGGTGNAGAGIKIAIIDTGIETTHPAFQDAALTPPAGFPKCDIVANCVFTNNKIIVARSYVSLVAAGTGSNPAADSRPDDYSARDRVGHGTAVAMAAAGLTSTGPADTITGVAPQAFLGNYKVFGSPGVNDSTTGDAIISALEDAYNDGMNIASISLGGTATTAPASDPEATAVQNAVSGGMLVVVAAGNNGGAGTITPSLGTVSSPADAPNAIAVAASTNSHMFANTLTVNGLGAFQSLFGSGPIPATTLTGPLSDVASVGDPLGCTPVPANSLTGTIALVERGTCLFFIKVFNLQVAGAIAVIFTNDAGDDTLVEAAGLNGTTTIPSTFIGYDDGQTIRAYLKSNPQATVSLSAAIAQAFPVSTYNEVAGFSSRGPVVATAALKPDVIAAGTNLYLAAETYDPNGDLYSATGYIVSNGTSFSTPQISGIAALVMQANPKLTPLQVKSAIVNTATQDVTDPALVASVTAVGAGKASAGAAVSTNLIASPTAVSFGVIKTGALPATQQILLTNIGTTALTLSVSINRRTTETNTHISINLPNLTIAAGQTSALAVTLSGTVPTPGAYEGLLSIQGAENTLVIPFYYVVGTGVPYDIISVAGNGDTGIAGQKNSEGVLLFQVLDQYGISVEEPFQFTVTSGGGSVSPLSSITNSNGFGEATIKLGTTPGTNVFTAIAGPLSTTFTITSTLQPAITPYGAVNAANDSVGAGLAPGSYVTLFGANFAVSDLGFSTPYLPIALNGISVSFDAPGVSVPGGLWYVSPGQVNVQVPWELAGQTSAQIKVDSGDISGALYTLPLATYSPAFFEAPAGFVAALDQNNNLVTTANAVAQGSVVQLFLNGLGPVTNQPPSGMPSPSNPLATTIASPVVTIGTQTVPPQDILFSGLTPGSIGLYQIDAVVPQTGAGLQPITVSVGGVQSSASHIQIK